MKKVIVFVSSVFQQSRNGPSIYANYLHEFFSKNKNSLEFIMVTPRPWTESIGISIITYIELSQRARAICRLYRSRGYEVICHYNIPTNFITQNKHASAIITQANDTKQVELFDNFLSKLRQHGIKRVVSIFFRRLIEKRAFRLSDTIVTNSDYSLRVLRDYYGESYVFKRIYKAVDLDAFKSNATHRIENNPITIVTVGSDWKTKNFLFLIKAVEAINYELCDSIRLTIIGTDDAEFEEICKRHSFVDNVGPLSRVALISEVAKHELFILASKDEALGVALLEASALGLFVMGSAVGGIPEIIEDGESGFLFDPYEIETLRKCILRYLDLDNGARQQIIERSKRRARLFGKDQMLKQVAILYESHFGVR